MFFNRPVEVIREYAGHYGPDGIWVAPAGRSRIVQASVQPASPEDMELLPEGRRDRATFVLYAAEAINPAIGRENADVAVINGERYEAVACSSWQNSLIPHYRVTVVKLGEQP